MTATRISTATTNDAQAAGNLMRGWHASTVSTICIVVEWLFVLVVAILPIDAYIFLPGTQSGIFLSEALTAQALVLFIVGYGLALIWRIPFPLSFPIRWLAPLGALLGASLISLLFAHARGVGLRECAQYAFFLVLFLLACAVARQQGIRNRVFWGILAGYYVVIILGLIGTLTNLPDFAKIILDIQRNTATLPGTLTPRAESTFRFPDELNAYLLLVLPFLIACAFNARSRIERVMFSMYVALGLWLLIQTYARSALILVVIITPLLLYLLGGLRLSLVGILVVALGLGVALAHDVALLTRGASLFDLQNSGYSYRLQTWRWALSAFTHHPLFGVGPRNLQFWPGAPWADAFRLRREDNGENSYINTLADLGILGFTALMVCIVAVVRRLRSGLADQSNWLSRSWHIGFLVGFCALLLDSFVHPTITSTQVTALLCAFVGLAGVYPQSVVVEPMEIDIALAKIASWKPLDIANQAAALNSRVVFLVNSPGFGGAELHSINLAGDLHRRGVRVLVVCPPGSPLQPLLLAQGIPYQTLALGMPIGRIKGVLGTLNYFLNPLSRSQFQSYMLALASEERSMFVCPFPREQLLATPLCQKLNVPIIWGIHAPMSYLPHRLLLRATWHRRAKEATALFTVSEAFTWRLSEDGFPTQHLVIMHNAIPQQAILTREEALPVPGRLVIVSRLTKMKGIQYAIRALPQLRVHHPEAHLLVIGAGPFDRSLRQLAHRLGVREHVRFLGYQSNPIHILSSASVLLCPSVEPEVLPTTILEAYGAGVPVVASRIGGIPEIVHNGETGLLVAPGDPAALAEAIALLLSDAPLAQSLGSRGQELARKDYNFDRVGSLFTQMLRRIELGESASMIDGDFLTISAEMAAIHRPRLLGNIGLFAIAKVLTALATALWTVLAARALTPASYGNLMLAASLAELSAIITDAGVTSIATRELAGVKSANEARQWTLALLYLKVALGLVATLVTIAMGFLLPFGEQTRLLLIILSPGLIFISLNSLTLVFRARMLFPLVVRIAFAVAIVNIVTALAVYVVAPSALSFALADLIATAVAGVLTTVLVYRETLRGRWAELWPNLRPNLSLIRGLLLSSLMLGLSMALNIFYIRIDVPLLALLTNSSQVAVYTSAYRVIDVVSLLPVSAAGVALPLLVSFSQRGREHLRAFAQQYLDIAVVCGVFIALVLTLIGHEVILLLYGSRYVASAPVLLVLSWAGAAMFVTNVFSPLAVALDKRRTLLMSAAIGLVVNVGLNLLLIPRLGPVGCAWATLFTEFAVTAPLLIVSVRSLHWRIDPYTIIAALEATGVALLSTIVTRSLAVWESDALALLIWMLALLVLAPGWVSALARSLAVRLRGSSVFTGEEFQATLVPWTGDEK